MQGDPTTNAMPRTACDTVENLKTLHIDVVKNPADDEVRHHPSAETKIMASKNCERYSCDYVVNCKILPSDRTQWASSAIQQHSSHCIDQSHKSDCFSSTKPTAAENKVPSIQVANSNSKPCLSRPNSASSAGFLMAEESLSQSSKHKSTTKTSYTSATMRNTTIAKMERNGTKMMNKGSKAANEKNPEKVDSSNKSNSPCVCPSFHKAGINTASEGKSKETSSQSSDPALVDDDPLPPSTASSSTICLSSLSSSTTTGTSSLFGRSATNYEEFFAKLGLPGYESLQAKKDVKMESGDTVNHSAFAEEALNVAIVFSPSAQAEHEINFSHVIGGGIIETDFDKHSLSTIFSTEEKSAVAACGKDNNLSNSTMTLHSAKDSAPVRDDSVGKLIEAVVKEADNCDDVEQKSPIIDDKNYQMKTVFNVNDEKRTISYKPRGQRKGRGQRVLGIVPLAQPKFKSLARRPSLIFGGPAAARQTKKCSSVNSNVNAAVAGGDSGQTILKSSARSVVVVSNTSFRSRHQKFASREILRAAVSEPHLIAGRDDESRNLDSKMSGVTKNRMIVVKMNTAAKLRAKAIKKKYSLV
uniref:Uncharacterized protein n=1 Tax=Romanomermis culicivorax TaxID=13658 RepID=A0A915KY36_ROMCU